MLCTGEAQRWDYRAKYRGLQNALPPRAPKVRLRTDRKLDFLKSPETEACNRTNLSWPWCQVSLPLPQCLLNLFMALSYRIAQLTGCARL